MIWVIASVPFWGIALVLFVLSFGAIYSALEKSGTGRPEECHRIFMGAMAMFVFSGLFGLIAAKICS
jgi:hypothetical protein